MTGVRVIISIRLTVPGCLARLRPPKVHLGVLSHPRVAISRRSWLVRDPCKPHWEGEHANTYPIYNTRMPEKMVCTHLSLYQLCFAHPRVDLIMSSLFFWHHPVREHLEQISNKNRQRCSACFNCENHMHPVGLSCLHWFFDHVSRPVGTVQSRRALSQTLSFWACKPLPHGWVVKDFVLAAAALEVSSWHRSLLAAWCFYGDVRFWRSLQWWWFAARCWWPWRRPCCEELDPWQLWAQWRWNNAVLDMEVPGMWFQRVLLDFIRLGLWWMWWSWILQDQ